MDDIRKIIINKNRGWRGLAELTCLDGDNKTVNRMIFSFSQPVWDDMMGGYIVTQDKEFFYVIEFNNTYELPTGQRSVLLKNFVADALHVNKYDRKDWMLESAGTRHHGVLYNFIRNNNNHTTSDWNYIGVRVTPNI